MQKSNIIKNDFITNSIKVEAHLSDYEFGQSSTNKSLTSKSFIEDLSKKTKNYDRVSQTYFQHSLLDFNKDSGIDSNRDYIMAFKDEENLFRLRQSSNSDVDIKNNRKLIKRLIKNDKRGKKMKKTSVDSSSSLAIETDKLKRELKNSKDLDERIQKAIIDLLALDKLEKQKKLNILNQQKVIQLQKVKLQNLKFVKSSLTNLHDEELYNVDNNRSISEDIKFPTLVRRYNPYSDLDDIHVPTVDNESVKLDNYDQFYMKNKSLINYKNNISYDEIMKIINEIETREKLSGNFSNSSYFYNGHLIKAAPLKIRDSSIEDTRKSKIILFH